jgi:hypothetical protein
MKPGCLQTCPVIKAALVLVICLLWPPVRAAGEAPQWSGSLKSLDIYGEASPADLFTSYYLSSNKLRLNMDWQAAPEWRFEGALEHQYLWSDPAEAFTVPTDDQNRHLDLDKTWRHDEHGSSRLQVDRLNLQWRSGPLDATVGRQAVGFGRILISSPLDVINPFPPEAIDTDVRSGIDALHTIFNYGLDGQLGGIAVWGDEARHDSFLATWTDNRSGVDLLMIGGRLRGRSMFGAGLAGSLGTLGLKGEFSIHKGRDVGEIGGDLYDSYTLAAVETWYRFDNGISLVIEYLYNGPGADNPEDYPEVINSAPLQEGLTYLLGRHYLMVAPSYELHPLATLQGLAIYNLDDDSALLRPTLDLSLADNLSLQLFWTWYTGESPRVVASAQFVAPRSEYGMLGDSGGFFLKWFF